MRLLFASPLLALAAPALAQTPPTPPDAFITGGDSITIGAGAVFLPDYEGSDDYQITPAPGAIGSIDGHNFQLAGNRFSFDLIPNKPGPGLDVQLGPIGVLNLNRSRAAGIDDPRVRALGGRGAGIELGGFVGLGRTGVITSEYDRLSVSLSVRHDVAGAHGSTIWQPTVNYTTPLSRKALVGLFVSAERAGQGYADAYFTVRPDQVAASGLPAFRARAGWKNYTIGALGAVALTGDLLRGWKLVGGGTYNRMLGDFRASPVVSIAGKTAPWFGVLGVAYTF